MNDEKRTEAQQKGPAEAAAGRLLDYVNELKAPVGAGESAQDMRRELAAEKRREKKPLSTGKKLLIGAGILLILALPWLVRLFWTLSGYFGQKPL